MRVLDPEHSGVMPIGVCWILSTKESSTTTTTYIARTLQKMFIGALDPEHSRVGYNDLCFL